MMKILVLNGPNLNLLGTREVHIYGTTTLKEIDQEIQQLAQELGVEVEFYQSNKEGELIDKIHDVRQTCKGIVINPGGYTHTSYSLQDAIAAVDLPTVEVHISNVYKRDAGRQKSLTACVCIGQITGFGKTSYLLGLRALVYFIQSNNRSVPV